MAAAPSPHLWAFLSPAEPVPAFTAAPADAAARDRILLLAKYAMQNGTSFVDMVRTNQGSNPEYAFLTPGGTDHAFFRWALFATGCGLPVEHPPPQGFVPPVPQPFQQQQQHQQPPVQVMQPQQPPQYNMPPQQPAYAVPPQQQYAQQPYAPPAPQYQQPHAVQQQQPQPPPARPQPPHIPPDFAAGFSQVLDNLSGSKDSIKASQGWFMACAAYAAGLAYMMAARAASLQDFDKLLHLIYLANEILFKAMQQAQGVAKPEEGQQHLDPAAAAAVTAAFVPAAGVIMAAAHAVAQAAGNAEGSAKLDKMLSFWRDKGVFDAGTIARFTHEMQAGNAQALLLANYPPAQQPQPPQPAPPPPQQLQQPQPGWGPAGTPLQPQAPVSGGWGGAPSPHMPTAPQAGSAWGPPAAFQPQQPYPQQPAPGGWGQPQQPPPPAAPWGAPAPPAAAYPAAGVVQPPYPGAIPTPPGQYPGAVPPPGFPGAPVGAVPTPGHVPPHAVPQPAAQPQPEPVSSLAFPPGLLPTLCREKSKYSEPYAAIEPIEIDKAGLPLPPEKDAYLKSRMDKFMLELRDYKAGSCRADLEESRAAARAQQGLEPDSDEELALGSTGSRLARRKALGSAGFEGRRRRRALGPVVGGMAEDGTYVGPGGARGERLGLGAHSSTDTVADLGDVYSSYRKMRSTSYHQMIVEGAGVSNMAKGG